MRTFVQLGFLCLLLIGCREDFIITNPPEQAFDFNIFSELSPNQVVSLELREITPIGQPLQPFNRRDAHVLFSGLNVPGGSLEMVYNSTSEKYLLLREDFRVSEGFSYDISIIIPEEGMDTITATATIPSAVRIENVNFIRSERIPIDNEFSHFEVELVIRLSEPKVRPAYYRFEPYRLESVLKIRNGVVSVVDVPNKSPFDVIEVKNNQNAIGSFEHREGLIIEESRLTENEIHLLMRTREPLRDGDIVDVTDEGKEVLTRLQLEMHTLSEEIYEFDRFVDEQLVNQGNSVPNPARIVSNIENASGVFAGSSKTVVFPRIAD